MHGYSRPSLLFRLLGKGLSVDEMGKGLGKGRKRPLEYPPPRIFSSRPQVEYAILPGTRPARKLGPVKFFPVQRLHFASFLPRCYSFPHEQYHHHYVCFPTCDHPQLQSATLRYETNSHSPIRPAMRISFKAATTCAPNVETAEKRRDDQLETPGPVPRFSDRSVFF